MTLELSRAAPCHLSFYHICQGIKKGDKQLCAWSQICSGGKGWCHGIEESIRTSICR